MNVQNKPRQIFLASIFICFLTPQVQAGFWDDAVNTAKSVTKQVVEDTVDEMIENKDKSANSPSKEISKTPVGQNQEAKIPSPSVKTEPVIANAKNEIKISRPVDAVDIIGLSIGMSPQEVINVLKERGLIIAGQRIKKADKKWLAGHEFTVFIKAMSQERRGNTESVTISFSAPPAKNLVQAIFRGKRFAKGKERLSDSISKALINKYGQPSYRNKNSSLIWAFDENNIHDFDSKEVSRCTSIKIKNHSMEEHLGWISTSCDHSIISVRVGNSTDFTNSVTMSLVDYPTIFINQRKTKEYNKELIEIKARKRREEAEKQELGMDL